MEQGKDNQLRIICPRGDDVGRQNSIEQQISVRKLCALRPTSGAGGINDDRRILCPRRLGDGLWRLTSHQATQRSRAFNWGWIRWLWSNHKEMLTAIHFRKCSVPLLRHRQIGGANETAISLGI